jgi:hypothetical protein
LLVIVDCALGVVVIQGWVGRIYKLPGFQKEQRICVHLLCNFSAFALLLVLGVDGLLFLLNELGLFKA